ncbi:hypothetical protein Poli38472_006437 [Pythium oligandrum]|uniref:Uncharacterized protein n=1 Tax=Pythium oligandrum TaxID=41045 RepID=A0A8K1C5G8_PYTOL|nr:hypothetical protein Poli38472_006437 [Pythium oligandrum]|eukprot:TMW56427.1 hypothetical protein Poli38472_006437 [Pythium oligandrum]
MSHASSDRETTERAEEHYMEEEKEDMADDEVHESKAEAVDATAVVLEWLHRNGMAVKPTGVKVLLSLDDDGLAMVSEIQRALPDLRMPPKAWGPLIKFVQDGVKQHEKEDPVSLDSNALELRNEEFTSRYQSSDPIFTPSDNSNEPAVSMIVIQVKNRKGRDAAFPDSATISTRPELTFKGELSKFAIHEVLRIYMSLHGVKRMEQFFTVDPGIRKGPRSIEKEIKAGKIVKTEGPPKPDAVVLCIRGLGGWFAKSLTKGATCMEGDTEVETMELENLKTVISSGVATQLTSFLGPYWKLEEMVLADLDQRDNLGESYGMDRDEVIQIANRPMVKTVLARTWKYHATDAEALFYNDEYDDDDDDDDDDDMDHSYKTKTKQQLGSSSAEPVNKRFKES